VSDDYVLYNGIDWLAILYDDILFYIESIFVKKLDNWLVNCNVTSVICVYISANFIEKSFTMIFSLSA